MSFPYRPLNRERSEVRLIRLVDGPDASDEESPIRLRLRHASLSDNNTDYAALSYAWGTAAEAAEVYIDGCSVEIGRNLHDALIQLRRYGITSWLWVDAICIQQFDAVEKSWQVEQMRAVFSQAEMVYTWLGLGCDATDRAMDWFSRVGPRALSSGALDLLRLGGTRVDTSILHYIESRYSSSEERPLGGNGADNRIAEVSRFLFDLLNEQRLYSDEFAPKVGENDLSPGKVGENDLSPGILNLMRRDYWTRIWVIQEISLGKDATVLCGAKAVPLDWLDATLLAVYYCMRSGFTSLHPDIRTFGRGLVGPLPESVALTTRRHYRRRDQACRGIYLADIVHQLTVAPGRPHYSTTDPRDILFGLLGVIPDENRDGVEVDYTLNMAQVFTILTKALIRDGDRHPRLFHLDSCVPRDVSEENSSLPSWVPDWREVGRYGIKVYAINHTRNFEATAGIPAPTPHPLHKQDDPLELLRRRGCRVDTITEVMDPPEWIGYDEWSATVIVNVKAWLESILAFTGLGAESGPAEDYIWRTVQNGALDPRKQARLQPSGPLQPSAPEDIAYLVRRIFRDEPIDTDQLNEEQQECIRSGIYDLGLLEPDLTRLDEQLAYVRKGVPNDAGSCMRRRTLFKTNKSMLGVGHVAVRAGDVLTLLAGVRSPIVLRPQTAGRGGGFTFVGDAYVDGIMHGQFLRTAPSFEEFEIY